MEIVVTGRHTEVSERFRQQAVDKLAKVPQLAPRAHRIDVELSHERNPRQAQTSEKVEITVRARGPVIRAEASADDPYSALDIALGKLLERLRRTRDRRKVHYGRQTPASVRTSPATGEIPVITDALLGAGMASLDGVPTNGSSPAGHDLDDGFEATGSPVVIRTKDHSAVPMTLDQALYEMELVGHDFFLFVDSVSGCPSVVYRRRRGWNYGVIRLHVTDPAQASGVEAEAVLR
ncbi:MAG: ribosome-associated translation inhibitor RaiA [Actinomycetales bacterium]|nr:ribosome-associated translation inhibitor RaiA [Actinomycetales bacterium]